MNYNVRNFRQFLVGMSPDVPTFDIKMQNLELVNLKCVSYAQHIPLSLRRCS